jgi:hypothetical protein
MSNQRINSTNTFQSLPIDGIEMIIWPYTQPFIFLSIPEIRTSKSANYGEQNILGRSSPVNTYSNSGNRKIDITFHLHSVSKYWMNVNVLFIQAICACVHPRYENTYAPPPVVKFKCGELVGNGGYCNLLIESVDYSMNQDEVWFDPPFLIPQYIPLTVSAKVVYPFAKLPGTADVALGRW